MSTTKPFSISPNPNLLYLTDSLKGYLYQIRRTINGRQGLSTIIGDVGFGKSTLLRYLFSEYHANEEFCATYIATPNFPTTFAFLKRLSSDFGIDTKRSFLDQSNSVESYLAAKYEAGENIVLFLDEGQILTPKFFEFLRSLLNFETKHGKFLQIVLAGQVELLKKLNEPRNRHLKSRIHTSAILNPLTREEMEAMIRYRCSECQLALPFNDEALERIYRLTRGIPRDVLKICDKSHDYTKLEGKRKVSLENIEVAFEDSTLKEELSFVDDLPNK